MDIKFVQVLAYIIAFSSPLLLQWLKFQREKKSNKELTWKTIFSSSFEIIITSAGFIYVLVEKDSKFQILYSVAVVLFILGMIFEEFEGEKRWMANILLMAIAVFLPAYFLFFKGERPAIGTAALAETDMSYLATPSEKVVKLKEICAGYLSENKSMSEAEFSSIIKGLSKTDINEEEKNLFMACLLLQKEKYTQVEDYLKKVQSPIFNADKSFIKFKASKSNYDVISKLDFNEDSSWLGISKEKMAEVKRAIGGSYKQALKILILDASAGRGRQATTARGSDLDAYLKSKEYSGSDVRAFDYVNTDKDLLYSGFYSKSNVKKGMTELGGELMKIGYPRHSLPSIYVSKIADTCDLVVLIGASKRLPGKKSRR
jgi:hypothetical protein